MCWQGYPLVHNAHLCADLGYYYEENDVTQGTARLLEVIDSHNAQAADYLERQRAIISRYAPDNATVTAAYSALLNDLMYRPAR